MKAGTTRMRETVHGADASERGTGLRRAGLTNCTALARLVAALQRLDEAEATFIVPRLELSLNAHERIVRG